MANGNGIADEILEQAQLEIKKGPKAAIKYLWSYYKYHALILIIILVCLGNFIYGQVTKKEAILTCYMVNTQTQNPQIRRADELIADYEATITFDPKHECITLDAALMAEYDSGGIATNDSYPYIAKIMAGLSTGYNDVLISNNREIDAYARDMVFCDLTTVLEPDLYEQLKAQNKIYFIHMADDTLLPVAVDMKGCKKLMDYGLYNAEDEIYYAFPTNAKRRNEAVDFLKFLLDI